MTAGSGICPALLLAECRAVVSSNVRFILLLQLMTSKELEQA